MALRDLRQLEAFRFLAQTGSFAETAEQMGVTSSAISHSLKNLETSLGRTLLSRGGKHLSLTKEGERLLRHTNSVFSRLDLAFSELTEPDGWASGCLRVGAEDSIAGHILPDALLEMRSYFPDADIKVCTDRTEALISLLRLGQLDVVIGIHFPDSQDYGAESVMELFMEELCVLLPRNHDYQGEDNFDWMQEQSVFVLEGSAFEEAPLSNYWREISGKVPVIQHVQSGNTLKRMVMAGMGVGVASKWMAAQELASGELLASPIHLDSLKRSWVVFAADEGEPNVLRESLVGLLKHSSHLITRPI